MLRAEEDAGELRPSIDVSRKCFEEDVVEDEGEFAAFKVLEPVLLDFDPCLDAIIAPIQFFNKLNQDNFIFEFRKKPTYSKALLGC